MATTTIRLPDELKTRVSAAAERCGMTAHSFILNAIAEKIEQDERRAGFEREAQARLDRLAHTGRSISWADMKRHLQDRAAGEATAPPVARRMGR